MKPFIHPKTPPKLARVHKRNRYKYHRTAKAIGLNVRYVYDLIHYGKEPNDTTETLRNIRKMLGLTKRKKHPDGQSRVKPEPTVYIKWWRRLDKGSRDQYIRNTYDYVESVK